MRHALEKLAAGWAVLGGLILLAIVFVTAANVGLFALDRLAGFFGASVSALPGYEDFVRLAVAAALPMLLPFCQLRRGHIAVDLFLKSAPARLNRALDRVLLVLMAAAALFLAYWMALGMAETRDDGALSRVLGWQEWPFYLPGIASLILWAAVALAQVFEKDAAQHG